MSIRISVASRSRRAEDAPLPEFMGRQVQSLSRLGKRLVFHGEGSLSRLLREEWPRHVDALEEFEARYRGGASSNESTQSR